MCVCNHRELNKSMNSNSVDSIGSFICQHSCHLTIVDVFGSSRSKLFAFSHASAVIPSRWHCAQYLNTTSWVSSVAFLLSFEYHLTKVRNECVCAYLLASDSLGCLSSSTSHCWILCHESHSKRNMPSPNSENVDTNDYGVSRSEFCRDER